MNLKKVIKRRIRHQAGGVNAAGDVDAVISANVGEGSSRTHVSTRSRQRIVQRSGRERTSRGGEHDEPAGGSQD